MTDIQTLELLLNDLTISPPSDTGDIAINSISGGNIVLGTDPGGTENQWMGSILEITSGPNAGLRAIITGNNGTSVTFGTPFAGNTYPVIGNTVKLMGGPLSEARKYLFEPYGVQEDIAEGIQYFVTASVLKGKIGMRGFAGHSDTGAESRTNIFDIQITAETPDAASLPTEADAYRLAVELPSLKEQIVFFMHRFRFNEANRITSSDDIAFMYGYMPRPGGRENRVCVLDMRLQIL